MAKFIYPIFGSIGLAAGIILYPTETTPESGGGIVSTKSGTYQIRAPLAVHLTKEEQLQECQFYVEKYEKVLTPSSWYRRLLEKECGINPDDIVNNIRG